MFSVICITWKNQKMAQDLVDSIRKYSFYEDHDILVGHQEDNGKERIISANKDIWFKENTGLSFAANKVSEFAIKDYICLIDDDMLVTENWDINLFLSLKRFGNNWVSSTVIEPIAPHYNIEKKKWDEGRWSEERPYYHNISNTPLLIPRDFWKRIGGYDEDFSNSGAELGLAKKAYDHGERLFLQIPHSYVIHYQSQSFKKLPGLKEARNNRDEVFKKKYGITRKEFVKLIKKGEVYDPSF